MERQRRAGAEVVPTDTPARLRTAVRRAVGLLAAGKLVGLPTETVYGLAANAWDATAVRRIFTVKGRPRHNPIIVHVASISLARRCAARWPPQADQLARAFWPGPLTMVLWRAEGIPDVVTAGGNTVGIRWPRHPVAQAVIRACGFPLAAPSANRSAAVSPTTADHVRRSLGRRLGLILDGGPAEVGIESTVVDLTGPVPRLLRAGMIPAESLAAILGRVEIAESSGAASGPGRARLRSPGLLRRHYAPRARLVVWSWRSADELLARLAPLHLPLDKVHVIVRTRPPPRILLGRVAVLGRDPIRFGRDLYAELHRCDEKGARLIVVQAPPPAAAWRAIRDRLQRAAAH